MHSSGFVWQNIYMVLDMRNRHGWFGLTILPEDVLNLLISYLPFKTIPVKYQHSTSYHCGTPSTTFHNHDSALTLCYLLSLQYTFNMSKYYILHKHQNKLQLGKR